MSVRKTNRPLRGGLIISPSSKYKARIAKLEAKEKQLELEIKKLEEELFNLKNSKP